MQNQIILSILLAASTKAENSFGAWPKVEGSCSNTNHVAANTFYAFLEKDGWDVNNPNALPMGQDEFKLPDKTLLHAKFDTFAVVANAAYKLENKDTQGSLTSQYEHAMVKDVLDGAPSTFNLEKWSVFYWGDNTGYRLLNRVFGQGSVVNAKDAFENRVLTLDCDKTWSDRYPGLYDENWCSDPSQTEDEKRRSAIVTSNDGEFIELIWLLEGSRDWQPTSKIHVGDWESMNPRAFDGENTMHIDGLQADLEMPSNADGDIKNRVLWPVVAVHNELASANPCLKLSWSSSPENSKHARPTELANCKWLETWYSEEYATTQRMPKCIVSNDPRSQLCQPTDPEWMCQNNAPLGDRPWYSNLGQAYTEGNIEKYFSPDAQATLNDNFWEAIAYGYGCFDPLTKKADVTCQNIVLPYTPNASTPAYENCPLPWNGNNTMCTPSPTNTIPTQRAVTLFCAAGTCQEKHPNKKWYDERVRLEELEKAIRNHPEEFPYKSMGVWVSNDTPKVDPRLPENKELYYPAFGNEPAPQQVTYSVCEEGQCIVKHGDHYPSSTEGVDFWKSVDCNGKCAQVPKSWYYCARDRQQCIVGEGEFDDSKQFANEDQGACNEQCMKVPVPEKHWYYCATDLQQCIQGTGEFDSSKKFAGEDQDSCSRQCEAVPPPAPTPPAPSSQEEKDQYCRNTYDRSSYCQGNVCHGTTEPCHGSSSTVSFSVCNDGVCTAKTAVSYPESKTEGVDYWKDDHCSNMCSAHNPPPVPKVEYYTCNISSGQCQIDPSSTKTKTDCLSSCQPYKCSDIDPNCETCTPPTIRLSSDGGDAQCNSCAKDYTLQNGKCIKPPAPSEEILNQYCILKFGGNSYCQNGVCHGSPDSHACHD